MAKKKSKALTQKVHPDRALASIIGCSALVRSDIIKKLWSYFRSKKLNKGRVIKLDATLKASKIWGSKSSIDMTEVGKALKHAE